MRSPKQFPRRGPLALLLAAVALLAPAAPAEDWPQFRGPRASGVSGEPEIPSEWSASKNIRWKVEIPGTGWSSPIVWGSKVLLTTAVAVGEERKEDPKKGLYFGGKRPPRGDTVYRWEVHCLNRDDGKTLWSRVAVEKKPATSIQPKDSYASPTPLTDGERVYAYFGASGLYAFTLAGEPAWQKDLGKFRTMHGWASSSPALEGDRLFVLCDNEDKSFLLALDKKTGQEQWRVDRDEKSSWGSPFVWRSAARVELVTCASKLVRSYDPANGNLLWAMGGMAIGVCPTPVASPDLLYLTSGGYVFGDFRKPLYAVRPGATGEISLGAFQDSNAGVAWCQGAAGPYIPSPLLYGDAVYVLYDQGFFAAFDAKTGKPLYPKKRIQESPTAFTASPWAGGGKIFCLSEDGDTFVIEPRPEFKVLGKNPLDEMCMASPAISGGLLFIRGRVHLFCIGKS
jgi:outer membrane protein assembly factor BamB